MIKHPWERFNEWSQYEDDNANLEVLAKAKLCNFIKAFNPACQYVSYS